MTPTYEELLKGSTQWRGDYMGLSYLLSHHGYRKGDEYESAEYNPGTWCYYLIVPEQMYPHRWADFAVTRKESGYEQFGPAFDHDMFDTEITWQSSEPYFDRKTERTWDAAKIGCDYAHLWHRERGYPDNYTSVTADAKRTIEKFLAANPDCHVRCDYSGKWDAPDQFYTAVNGRRVHLSVESAIDDGWVGWKRTPDVTPALAQESTPC
jgi:hypothetical protein